MNRESRAAGQLQETASGADSGHALDTPDMLHRNGLSALVAGRYDEAVEWISRAIRADPQPLYLTSLGTALLAQGRRDEALAVFDKAVQLKPDDAGLWCNLGFALAEAGRVADAIRGLQRALILDPHHFDAAHNAALLLHQEARYEEALHYFNISDAIRPDHFATLYMRAATLQTLRRFEEALADNRRARALDPGSADVRYKLASVLTELRRFDEAAAVHRDALAENPGDADAEWSLALLKITLGDFEGGLAAQEARWKIPSLSSGYPKFNQPKWLGAEPVAGKTVIVCANEGFGDSIQYVRYVPMLAARGARAVLMVPPPLCPLLAKLEGVAECVPFSAGALPQGDFHVPVSSLPLAFGTRLDTIPAEVPYLPAPDASRVQAFAARLGAHDRLRVGLVWSGNPNHHNDRNRSLQLSLLAPLFDCDARFVSLQKDPRPDDRAMLAQRGIIDVTADLHDFADTAALMSCLDLVISVDTSMAHLAGALGRPVWVLLPYAPDFRWLLDREDSPWYPTARLFRQSERRDYAAVIARVKVELQAEIAARSPNAAPAALSATALFFNAALAEMQAGRADAARRSCEQALALHPDHAETLHLMGVLLLNKGQVDTALDWITRAIRSDPKPLYLVSLGTLLLGQGRIGDAVAVFDKAVQLKGDDAELWRHLGSALVEAGRPADAIAAFEQALKLNPNYLDVARALSLLLYQAERYEAALAHFDLSATLSPDHFPTHYMRALTLEKLGRLEEAIAENARAHAIDPANPDVCYNMGNVLRLKDRHREALGWYDKSAALRPDFAATLGNKGVVLAELRRFDEAIAAYRAALRADPQHVQAEWNLALLQLLLGDFDTGWRGQEARWKMPAMASRAPKLPEPKWLGVEAVAGKTVLVWSNEGFGDVIQFVRYVPMLAARGARVVLVVPDPLCALLSGVQGVAQCLPSSTGVWPERDYHVPLSSLPLAFGARLDTIPTGTYLPEPPAARVATWGARLGPHDRLRVGLVWSGNVNHNNDRNRSLPLRMLAPLLDLDARFVSLQKDPRPADAAFLRERPGIVDLAAGLTDFTDTAALIGCLDLVISVDTSVAHLAAALGRPTWILLPYTPDYRWLLDREDSPWYPSARLFRQDERRDYESLVGRVRTELGAAIANSGFRRTR